MALLNLDEKNFKTEVLDATLPVLVDFWAQWCGPCRMIAPVVDEVAKDLEGKLKVAKVDIDQAGELASQYNVMSIPTLLVFKNGKVVDQMVGVMSKEQLTDKLRPNL